MDWTATLLIGLVAIAVNTVGVVMAERARRHRHEMAILRLHRDHAREMCEGYRDSWAKLTRNPPHVLSWEEGSDG